MSFRAMHLSTQSETAALQKAVRSISVIPEVVRVALFGSRVRGDFTDSSDVDVLVVMRNMNIQVKKAIIRIFHDVEIEYEVPIEVTLLTNKEYEVNKQMGSSFVRNVEAEGVLVYDSD